VAANVRAALARQNKTRRELAAALGVDEHRIGKRTRGLVPFSVDEVVQVARFLGVTVEDLLDVPAAGAA
jgi:transcriptional regulator with XRE-family HTH domain